MKRHCQNNNVAGGRLYRVCQECEGFPRCLCFFSVVYSARYCHLCGAALCVVQQYSFIMRNNLSVRGLVAMFSSTNTVSQRTTSTLRSQLAVSLESVNQDPIEKQGQCYFAGRFLTSQEFSSSCMLASVVVSSH